MILDAYSLLGFAIWVAVTEWPVVASMALVLYILHRVVRSHGARCRKLEANRNDSPWAYVRWLLNP